MTTETIVEQQTAVGSAGAVTDEQLIACWSIGLVVTSCNCLYRAKTLFQAVGWRFAWWIKRLGDTR